MTCEKFIFSLANITSIDFLYDFIYRKVKIHKAKKMSISNELKEALMNTNNKGKVFL